MILEMCWDGLWTLSFGLSQFHGHGSWPKYEVTPIMSCSIRCRPYNVVFFLIHYYFYINDCSGPGPLKFLDLQCCVCILHWSWKSWKLLVARTFLFFKLLLLTNLMLESLKHYFAMWDDSMALVYVHYTWWASNKARKFLYNSYIHANTWNFGWSYTPDTFHEESLFILALFMWNIVHPCIIH